MSSKAEFKVYGSVQGVGYRYFAYKTANELGLVGYVKNTPEGGVMGVAEGEASALANLHSTLLVGPANSYIEKVDFQISEATGKFTSFEMR